MQLVQKSFETHERRDFPKLPKLASPYLASLFTDVRGPRKSLEIEIETETETDESTEWGIENINPHLEMLEQGATLKGGGRRT
jgi:hypothetical protein